MHDCIYSYQNCRSAFFEFFAGGNYLTKTQYLIIFHLRDRWEIKFHGDRPSRKSIWTNLDPKSSIFYFFCNFRSNLFSDFCPVGWKCGSLPMPFHRPCPCPIFPCQGRPLGPNKTGQKGSRTKWIQDKMDPGQKGTRTKWIQDIREP